MLFGTKLPAYLIDSENVGSTWTDLLKNEEKRDFYIFVTENAKSLNFMLLKELTEKMNDEDIGFLITVAERIQKTF